MPADVLVIVPTYNERENLEALTTAILAELPTADILVVDDGSPDGTGALADALHGREPRIDVLHRPSKQGLGTAYLAGFRHGLARNYAYFIEMDCDFSHDPQYLPALLERARAGADLVLGSRYIDQGGTRNWSLARRAISRGGNLYARAVLGLPFDDLTGGFKCFRRAVLERIRLEAVRSEGYAFQIEMTYRAWRRGFRIEEVPIIFVDRRVGQSKMSRRIVGEAVWMVWRLRWALRRG
ncbi:MAG: polyprenol monophosphomannose synthase [Proteobacteria bacterium]|nr:polyprenol monophosphomannose synthase [Pseudomonadota bacterium]